MLKEILEMQESDMEQECFDEFQKLMKDLKAKKEDSFIDGRKRIIYIGTNLKISKLKELVMEYIKMVDDCDLYSFGYGYVDELADANKKVIDKISKNGKYKYYISIDFKFIPQTIKDFLK
jgi:hypothetical protein